MEEQNKKEHHCGGEGCHKGKCHENNKHHESCKNNEVENLKQELELAKKTIEEQKSTITNYLSTASYYKNELDNTKKDFERIKERSKLNELEANVKANENVAKKLLPIIDNFDQAIMHVDPTVMKGFGMIYASLTGVLTDLGIVEISTKNEKLNPEKHNCISTETTDDPDLEDTICQVYQKGYMFAETNKIVRPATVSVYKLK